MKELFSYDREHELIKSTRTYYEQAQRAKNKGDETQYNKLYKKFQTAQDKLNKLREAM